MKKPLNLLRISASIAHGIGKALTYAMVATALSGHATPSRAQNVIQLENAKSAGVTTQWQIPDSEYAINREIEGYASASSLNRGESISLFVQTKTQDASHTINVYRVGWYGGAGARLVAGPIARSRTAQPACPITESTARLIECNWRNPYVLSVPNDTIDRTEWASGVYLAKLTGGSTGKQSYIIFVVRDDARQPEINFQTSVTTYVAYNNWGGYNLYDTQSQGGTAATKVSFDRPYTIPRRHLNGKGAGDFLSWEINMLRFLEREGYDTKYSTNIDTHEAPSRVLNQRMFMSVGHDEYYTRAMYDALEAARNSGVNLGFFGANAIYWQIRLESGRLSGQANRTVVGYKRQSDPIAATNPSLATYNWRETVRAPINRPEAGLIGVQYDYNSVNLDMVIADCPNWICAGTNLGRGSVLPGMLGYEVDRVAPSSPSGISIIAASPYDACLNATCSATERRHANMSYYTAASGAGVFATGSMQWNWGLDSFTPGSGSLDDHHGDRTNPAVQQVTRNVLNRFTGTVAPQITSIPITAATVGVAYSYRVLGTSTTAASGGNLTYALAQAPDAMSIERTAGLITWIPLAQQVGNQNVTVQARDSAGKTTSQAFTIIVNSANNLPEANPTPPQNAQTTSETLTNPTNGANGGGGGGGCMIGHDGRLDPSLAMLVLLALMGLLRRRGT